MTYPFFPCLLYLLQQSVSFYSKFIFIFLNYWFGNHGHLSKWKRINFIHKSFFSLKMSVNKWKLPTFWWKDGGCKEEKLWKFQVHYLTSTVEWLTDWLPRTQQGKGKHEKKEECHIQETTLMFFIHLKLELFRILWPKCSPHKFQIVH